MIWASLSLISRLLLGAVFLWAAWPKISSPADFAMIIYQYKMLPDAWINLIALILPWVEGVAAVFAVAAARSWRRASLMLLLGLLVFFTAVISIKLIQGVEIDCGCFSTAAAQGSVIGPLNLLRNTLLILLGLFALTAEKKSPPQTKQA